MIEPYSPDPFTGEITDGRILHAQAMSILGFDPSVAKLGVACVGMLDNCMAEIRAEGHRASLKSIKKIIVVTV